MRAVKCPSFERMNLTLRVISDVRNAFFGNR